MPLIMEPVTWVLAVFFLAAVLVQALGLVGTLLFRFQKLPALKGDPLPGVSIIKCCYDNKDNEAENFDRFFNQDYPGPLELIFVVSGESDPIVPTIRDYLRRYPKADAKLILSRSSVAYWNKVNALYDGQNASKHEIVIWSDSDTVVRGNYVSQMVACLQEPGVSVVTTPQYDFRADNFPTALKVLANNCDDASFIMVYNLFARRKKVALGHSLGFKKSEFEAFKQEAWDTIGRFLADDLGLPYVFWKHGKRVVFRNIYCPVQYSGKTLAQVIEQKRRWVMCQKQSVGNRFLYLLGFLFYPETPALGLALLHGFAPWTWAGLAIAVASRVGLSCVFEALFLGSLKMNARYFWTIPLWDLMQVGFVVDGFFRNTIVLGGKSFQVVDRFFLREKKPSV